MADGFRADAGRARHFGHLKTLSLIAGLTMWKFYFERFEDSIKGEQVIVFLRHLLRCIEGKLILVWDGLPAHRSKLVKEYLETVGDRVLVERLPAYAPELNPVEYIWAYLKYATCQPVQASRRFSEHRVVAEQCA